MVLQELKDLYKSILQGDGKKEAFGDEKTITKFAILFALVTIVLLQLFLGKYLWNNFLTKLVPIVQPAEGVVDILAISILFRLLFN